GQAQGAPVCEHLKTFATKVENDTIYIEVAP
ncbi:MAG: Rieske family ferredoxin, partial [Marinomonas sp.]